MGRLGSGDQAFDHFVAADRADRPDRNPRAAGCPADDVHDVVSGSAGLVAGLVPHQLDADKQQAFGPPVLIALSGHDRLQPRLIVRRQIVGRGLALGHHADGAGPPYDPEYVADRDPPLQRGQDLVRARRGRLQIVRTPGQVARNAGDGADEDQGAVAPGDRPHRGTGPPGEDHDLVQFRNLWFLRLRGNRRRTGRARGQNE